MIEFAVFRYRKDLRFVNGFNPLTFEYVGGFFNSLEDAKQTIPKDKGNYIYGIEKITKEALI